MLRDVDLRINKHAVGLVCILRRGVRFPLRPPNYGRGRLSRSAPLSTWGEARRSLRSPARHR